MNKLKIIIAVLALASLFFGQCACPYDGDNPVGAFSGYSHYHYWNSEIGLIDDWQTVDAKWSFGDGGDLKINQNDGKKISGYWTTNEKILEIIVDQKSTLYEVEKISENSIKLTSEQKVIVLTK